ncbi:hypothetical protein Clacol_007641 [Clathrus columnatus]|uniref:Arrestin-like N-terminal domain-containing protein n=1 Tax=Clathrus columnatus TaxID=1419009 RepID=A0AAV5AI05_9AGAM|nr:hypothetical protein Clacol_007641 [Clathrus columnatus]
MSTASLPSLPSYVGAGAADTQIPSYTARPVNGEQTLGQSKLKRGDLRDWSKKNGNVTLTLFDQPPDAQLPVFGRQSTIQGAIMLENTQDITSVNIKVHGYVKCKSLPEYGGSYYVLLEMPFTLWDKTHQEPCSSVLPINITLPANYTLNGKTGPLPPSFLYSFYDVQGGTPGQKTRIKYEIIVDVERHQSSLKDKIGHTLSTDFIYLPRSRPAKQPSTVPSTIFEVEMQHRHNGKAKEEDPIIWKLCLPPPGTYPLSRPIPFRVAVTSRSAALLTPFAPSKRDKSAIRVYLLRHVSFTTDTNVSLWRSFSIGEGVLTAAPPSDNLWLKNTVRRPGGGETASIGSNSDKEGWASYDWIGTVKANKDVLSGGFSVANVVVQDYIVLSVVPPNPRGGSLLEAKKSVPIQLTTDEYDSPVIPSEFYEDRKEPTEDDSDNGHDNTNGATNGHGTNGTNGTH